MEIYPGPDSILLLLHTSWLLPFSQSLIDINVSYADTTCSNKGKTEHLPLIYSNYCTFVPFIWVLIVHKSVIPWPCNAFPPEMGYKFLVTNKRECDRLAWRDVYYRDTECQVSHSRYTSHLSANHRLPFNCVQQSWPIDQSQTRSWPAGKLLCVAASLSGVCSLEEDFGCKVGEKCDKS